MFGHMGGVSLIMLLTIGFIMLDKGSPHKESLK